MSSKQIVSKSFIVSVIMSVYNGEKYVSEAIKSILNQTFTGFEFIIIDDCSTDHSLELIKCYQEQDERIVLIQNKKNIGLAMSLNNGISIARGKYIARMDADDISLPERFKDQVDFLENNPYIGVLGTWMEIIDSEGKLTGFKLLYPESPNLIYWTLFFSNSIGHSSVMMRRDLLLQVGCYQNLHVAQDYDLWCRLSKVTKLYNLPRVLLQLRKHETQITNQKKAEYPAIDISISQGLFSRFFDKPIPLEWIGCVRSNYCADYRQINNSCNFVLEFYKKFVRDNNLNGHEKYKIQKSTSDRIFKMAGKGGGHSRKYILWAFILDPSKILLVLKVQLKKVIKKK